MKITKQRLEYIIKDELSIVLNEELNEGKVAQLLRRIFKPGSLATRGDELARNIQTAFNAKRFHDQKQFKVESEASEGDENWIMITVSSGHQQAAPMLQLGAGGEPGTWFLDFYLPAGASERSAVAGGKSRGGAPRVQKINLTNLNNKFIRPLIVSFTDENWSAKSLSGKREQKTSIVIKGPALGSGLPGSVDPATGTKFIARAVEEQLKNPDAMQVLMTLWVPEESRGPGIGIGGAPALT